MTTPEDIISSKKNALCGDMIRHHYALKKEIDRLNESAIRLDKFAKENPSQDMHKAIKCADFALGMLAEAVESVQDAKEELDERD